MKNIRTKIWFFRLIIISLIHQFNKTAAEPAVQNGQKSMRKATFKKSAQKSTNNFKQEGFVFFKSMQYRWEETADPIREDVTYHLTEEEAIKATKVISMEIGFRPVVDKVFITYDELNENIAFAEEFELDELDALYTEAEEVYSGSEFTGESIEGAIVIRRSWEKYIGYASNFHGVRYGNYNETEASLKVDQDRVFHQFEEVLLTAKEIEGMNDDEILEAVMNEIRQDKWKWNYFNNRPTEIKVIEGLDLNISE